MLYYSFVSRIHTKPQFVHVVHRYVFFIFVYYKDDNFPMEIPKNFMPSETSGASGCKEVRDVLTQQHVPCPACVPLLTWRALVLFSQSLQALESREALTITDRPWCKRSVVESWAALQQKRVIVMGSPSARGRQPQRLRQQ
jgi:hypothetical protein